MTHVLVLALRYLRFNKIKTAILVFGVAVAVFLPLAVNLLVRDYQRELLARAGATPLVAGAPGGRFDLVLHALYFRGKPAHDLTMAEVDAINSSGLAAGIPIIAKHAAQGVPIVGTSLEYFPFRRLTVARGAGLTRLGDCILGAAAAEKLRVGPGDKLMSDPENVFDLAGSYPLNMRVAGVLAPAGTADDGAIFVDVKTAWLILGLMHGHQDAAAADPSLLLQRGKNNLTASEALTPYQEVTDKNRTSFHMHGDPATYPISAIIVVPRDEKSAAILRGRYQDPKSPAQLLVPKEVVAETLDLVFRVKRFFDAQSVLVGTATALLLALVVLLSLRLRRGEMETMFKIGCSRGRIFCLHAAELAMVAAAGLALAAAGSWIVLKQLGISARRAGAAPSAAATEAASRAKPRVAVTNYPLRYFTERIAGDRVDIVFDVPAEDDPAFWKPSDENLVRCQQVDLILLNGADYEKWLPSSVLPLTRQVNTSRAFAGRYIPLSEVVTHSHGPGGMHSHGAIDFNTWMDPQQAAQQAQAVRDELQRLLPGAKGPLDAGLQALLRDLKELDAALAKIPLQGPLLGSHPVYNYTARRYGWNLQSVHWEPDEMPSETEWQKLAALHKRHPAKLMLWEEQPLPAVTERLHKMGITPVPFETCANAPAKGDYLTVMKQNAQRLAAAVQK